MGITNSKMDELIHHPVIRIKRKNVKLIQKHSEIIHELFSVRVSNKTKRDGFDPNFVYVSLEWGEDSANKLSEITQKVQVGALP